MNVLRMLILDDALSYATIKLDLINATAKLDMSLISLITLHVKESKLF